MSAKLASYVKFYQNNKDFIDSLGKLWGFFFGGVERERGMKDPANMIMALCVGYPNQWCKRSYSLDAR